MSSSNTSRHESIYSFFANPELGRCFMIPPKDLFFSKLCPRVPVSDREALSTFFDTIVLIWSTSRHHSAPAPSSSSLPVRSPFLFHCKVCSTLGWYVPAPLLFVGTRGRLNLLIKFPLPLYLLLFTLTCLFSYSVLFNCVACFYDKMWKI